MGKTTRDQVEIDLGGPIDRAIAKLKKLKVKYPDGKIELTSETEYGERYEKLYLNFTRDKKPVELEYDRWRTKLTRYGELSAAARAYESEGDAYPRAALLEALREELGCWADNYFGSLTIYQDEVLLWSIQGARRRDGTWVLRSVAFDMFDAPKPSQETNNG